MERGRLSFAGLGVTRLQNRVVFIDESKAYYIDETGAQLIIWNPRDMLIERTVALPAALGEATWATPRICRSGATRWSSRCLYELSQDGIHTPAFRSVGEIRGVARLR